MNFGMMKELDTRYSDIEFKIFIFDGLKVILDQKYKKLGFLGDSLYVYTIYENSI